MLGAFCAPVSSQHPVGQENTAFSRERLCLQLGQKHQWMEATKSWKKTRLNPGSVWFCVCSGKKGAPFSHATLPPEQTTCPFPVFKGFMAPYYRKTNNSCRHDEPQGRHEAIMILKRPGGWLLLGPPLPLIHSFIRALYTPPHDSFLPLALVTDHLFI